MSACGTEQAPRDAESQAYVPKDTPVVRVPPVADPRRPEILFVATQVATLGQLMAGVPLRHRIAIGREREIYALDVFDGTLRNFGETGSPQAWPASGALEMRFEPAPLTVAVADTGPFVTGGFPGRLRAVDRSGELQLDVDLEFSFWDVTGLDDGSFVALMVETGVVGRYSASGDELARYTVFQSPEGRVSGEQRLWAQQQFTVGATRVYVTDAQTYEVTAFRIDGTPAWVLQADSVRRPIPEHLTGRTLGRERRAGRAAGSTIDAEAQNALWPEFYPTLGHIAADSEDRLFVFPYVVDENPDLYPVDIYDRDGRPIANGFLPFQGWDAVAEGAVYRIEEHNDANVVMRYELRIPDPTGALVGR